MLLQQTVRDTVDLGKDVSLKYLQRANVKLTFQTAPSEDVFSPAGPIDAVKNTAENLTHSKAWKKYRGAHDVYRRRAENASWRIWGMHRSGEKGVPESSLLRKNDQNNKKDERIKKHHECFVTCFLNFV